MKNYQSKPYDKSDIDKRLNQTTDLLYMKQEEDFIEGRELSLNSIDRRWQTEKYHGYGTFKNYLVSLEHGSG